MKTMKTMKTKLTHWVKTCLCLFSLLTLCASLTANGQETYKPMLKDGRVWNCIELWGAVNLDTLDLEYRIEGTIEKDGHVCYNLYQGSKQIGLLYEEGPKVFYHTENGWELLFDFSLSPGEVASEYYMVDEVKTIVMKGVPRRCLFFPCAFGDGNKECWIEGIGNSKTGPFYPYFLDLIIGHTIPISYRGMKLMSVYDGDVCIFEYDDLFGKGTSVPDITSTETTESTGIYDLQGRRLSGKPARGIYIENGKKIAIK